MGELVGSWQDEDALFLTCGDSFRLAIRLEIREDGEDLRGTLSMGDSDLPFVGSRTGRVIRGDVSDADKEVALNALLAYSSQSLKGKFEGAEASDCAAGGTSKVVYQVTMERMRDTSGEQ